MSGDPCTAPNIISLSPLSLATDVTDATFGASGLQLGTRTGAGGTATLTESFFDRKSMAPWTTGGILGKRKLNTASSTSMNSKWKWGDHILRMDTKKWTYGATVWERRKGGEIQEDQGKVSVTTVSQPVCDLVEPQADKTEQI